MTAGPGIRVVLFDLDDTLKAHRGAVNAGIAAYLQQLGWRPADVATEQARWTALEEQHYARYLTGELDFLGQRAARAVDFARPYGLDLSAPDEAEEWFRAYFEHYIASWRLHDDALPALDALERALPGVRFGVITNGEETFQMRKVERLGLTERFEHVVCSGALGVAKPDARIFAHACSLFGVAPSEAAYVGDRARTDALGAHRAGLTGVWLDREGAEPPAAVTRELAESGVPVIRDLHSLPAVLADAAGRE